MNRLHRSMAVACAASAAWLFCPQVLAQSAPCASTAAAAYEDWVSSPGLLRCAASGHAASEAVLGMLYWGILDADECDDSGCWTDNPESYGLGAGFKREVLEKEGRRLLESAGRKGEFRAQNELGRAFLEGLFGVEPDLAIARQWLTKATDGGDNIAPYHLARIYFVGAGVRQSSKTAERFLRLSATRGYKPARCSLIVLLERRQSIEAWAEKSVLELQENFGGGCSPDEIMAEIP